jgi:acetyltransferase-like isoleucine patch superfamily enzyme
MTAQGRRLPWDWHDAPIPGNVDIDQEAYLETSYSFHLFRGEFPSAVRIGRGASMYAGTMFDVGRRGRVRVGDYSLLNGAWIICENRIDIGEHVLISWNVVLMDSYRLPDDVEERRRELRRVPLRSPRRLESLVSGRPVSIESNVWIGFDACVLPGVTIGRGAVVGARSVVYEDVPAFTVVAGNPAQVIRHLPREGEELA